MPRGKTWTIRGTVLNRTQLESHVKRIKARLSGGAQVTKGDEDFEFMLELFVRHYPRTASRKIDPSKIMDLTVMNNPLTYYKTSSPTFFWIDHDGCIDNWNPKECWQKRNNRTEACKAFRRAIRDQCTDHWKKVCEAITNDLPVCPITGKPFDPRVRGEAIVHHDNPSFSEILKSFEDVTAIKIATVETYIDGGPRIKDRSVEIVFQEFHSIHARLIVVSKEGHDWEHYGGKK